MLCRICIVQIKPRKHILDHADTTGPSRQHELDDTDDTDDTDHIHQESIPPINNRSRSSGSRPSVRCVTILWSAKTQKQKRRETQQNQSKQNQNKQHEWGVVAVVVETVTCFPRTYPPNILFPHIRRRQTIDFHLMMWSLRADACLICRIYLMLPGGGCT